jgi:hypothetical protein
LAQGLKKLGERAHARTGSFVQGMAQGQLRILIHHQGQAQLPWIMPALFVVPALG